VPDDGACRIHNMQALVHNRIQYGFFFTVGPHQKMRICQEFLVNGLHEKIGINDMQANIFQPLYFTLVVYQLSHGIQIHLPDEKIFRKADGLFYTRTGFGFGFDSDDHIRV
jgi:hypothetical protein